MTQNGVRKMLILKLVKWFYLYHCISTSVVNYREMRTETENFSTNLPKYVII